MENGISTSAYFNQRVQSTTLHADVVLPSEKKIYKVIADLDQYYCWVAWDPSPNMGPHSGTLLMPASGATATDGGDSEESLLPSPPPSLLLLLLLSAEDSANPRERPWPPLVDDRGKAELVPPRGRRRRVAASAAAVIAPVGKWFSGSGGGILPDAGTEESHSRWPRALPPPEPELMLTRPTLPPAAEVSLTLRTLPTVEASLTWRGRLLLPWLQLR